MKTLIAKHNPLKVLLAEDDEDDQFIFSDAIKQLQLPIELKITTDGNGVLEIVKDNNLLPHIIFLDLNMPKMNGIECLKEIKKNKMLENIPCIILSTSTALKDIEETYNYGANLYLEKPYNYEGFISMFNKVLDLDWKNYSPPKRELFYIARY